MEAFNIHPEVMELFPELVAIRRDIHQHPEPLYDLPRTSALVAKYLEDLGIEVIRNVGISGVVGVIKGEGPCILLRADMDCLPISEDNDIEYKSLHEGLMHACGHDAHTAMLMVAAKVISRRKDSLKGSVKFLFQPAEEGGHGALAMIEDKVYPVLSSEPKVDEAYGIHVCNNHVVGDYLLSDTYMSAFTESFDIHIVGKGGHISALTRNPVIVGAELILAVQNIVSRNINNSERAVLSITSFIGGEVANAVPESCHLRGTIRAFEPEVRETINRRFEEICKGEGIAHGCSVELTLTPGYPPIINHASTNEKALKSLAKVTPNGKRDLISQTIGEDFSYLTQRVPGTFICLGTGNGMTSSPIHSSTFNLEENAMLLGCSYFVDLILSNLS